jgi:ABC-type nitrate/sulfonate/bicarbonate transport system permease component
MGKSEGLEIADVVSPRSARLLQKDEDIFARFNIYGNIRKWLVIVILVLVWETVARMHIFPPIILPAFSDVIKALYDQTVSGGLLLATWWSCFRVVVGFSVGLGLGFPLGLFIGWSRVFDELFNPIIELLRPIPPLAWIPLSVIWLGIGLKSVIFITTLGSFFPILVATANGVRSVDRKVIEFSRSLGATTPQILTKVVIPLTLPPAFVGMRIAIGFSWMCVVAAEMISVDYGLGWMIWKARYSFETDVVIAGMIVIGALSIVMTKGMARLEKTLFRWRENVVRG